MHVHVAGIDPGLRDTGVVLFTFDTTACTVTTRALVVDGATLKADTSIIRQWLVEHNADNANVFIEKYVPRPGMTTSPDMLALENLIRVSLSAPTLVRNTGVKQMVPPDVLQLLHAWRFNIVTNHDDLRAAARIAVYGMMKNRMLNGLLADVIQAHLDGRAWTINQEQGERYAP